MLTADLKIVWINRITNLKDDSIIEQIQRMPYFEVEEGIYKLTEVQTQKIIEARGKYLAGKILSAKKVNSEIEKWLNAN